MSYKVISKSLSHLENYILNNKYNGYDRYDGLTSPLFKLLVFKNRKSRLYIQQITKRLPFNFRAILRIPRGYNPVTLGLCLQAFVYLAQIDPKKQEFYHK